LTDVDTLIYLSDPVLLADVENAIATILFGKYKKDVAATNQSEMPKISLRASF
jgi:hypothetical protein